MEPAASARNVTESAVLVQAWPMTVPRNVGPPPIRPRSARNFQLGRSPDMGATMPNPSVALCRPKPMMRTSARPIAPVAPACPIASPSEKLCSPIPVAMSRASHLPGDSPATQFVSNSAAEAAPGPSIDLLRSRDIQRS